MNKKNKIFILISLSLFFIPTLIFSAIAPPTTGFPAIGSDINNLQNTVFVNIVNFLSGILIIAGVIGVIIAGYFFISSGGDSGKVSSARNWLIYSLVGVFVGWFSYEFITWVTIDNFNGGIGNTIRISFLSIASWLSGLLIISGAIGIIFSGFTFVSSGGDSGKVTSARNWLIYSLVGLIVGGSSNLVLNWESIGGITGYINNIGLLIDLSLNNIAIWLSGILVLSGVIGIVISGFTFVSSGGDSGKVTSARNWLIYSLVGVFVGWFSYEFITWVTIGNFSGGIGDSILQSLLRIANWMFSILLVAGVMGVVFSGYLFLNSGGEAGKFALARSWLAYSLVGVFVGAISRTLVAWAINYFN